MTAAGGWELVTVVDEQNPDLGDLRISGARLAKVSSFGDAVRQAVEVRLRWWLGEWFLDTSRGVPYLQQILRKGVSAATVRAVLKREVEATEGVARLLTMAVDIDRTTRRCVVSDVEIRTTESDEPVRLEALPVGRF